MTPVQLIKGQNMPLHSPDLVVVVRTSAASDLSALLVTAAGRVRSDADFVFYNQPHAPGADLVAGALRISLAQVPAGIDQIRTVITLDDQRTSFGQFPAPIATVTDHAGNVLCEYRIDQLGPESVVIALEVYRRDTEWKVRAVGQGYAGGFAALVTDHGVTVDDSPAPSPAVPVTPARDPSGVRTVAGEATLSLEKRQTLDLRKREVAKVLLTKGASGIRARVILVIDKTGSFSGVFAVRSALRLSLVLRLLRHGERVQGRCSNRRTVDRGWVGEHSSVNEYVFAFRTHDGRNVEFTDHTPGPFGMAIGAPVRVSYDPADPVRNATVAGPGAWGPVLMPAVFTLVLGTFAMGLLLGCAALRGWL
ncbi:TerD family protein [Nocardia sp. CA-151230]|uniref:TerD family protein n=1 Tax=Nocardia sp. CA-151230 TaxID=3239982 RepID=UPI003D90758E